MIVMVMYLQGFEHSNDSKRPEAEGKSENGTIDLTHWWIWLHISRWTDQWKHCLQLYVKKNGDQIS